MKPPILFSVMLAALPVCAAAQAPKPGSAPARPDCTGSATASAQVPRASGALPARASTRPEPQRSSVAPPARVPSHTETPSLRAMRSARAKEAGSAPDAPAGTGLDCAAPAASAPTPREEGSQH